jgi:hypothetical protein
MMKKLLLLLVLLCAPAFAQTAYYADRAVGVSPFGSILGLVPVQYGQVRVCDLPLTQISPCLPLASITGVPGFPVDTSGTKFGQVVTLVTGQFAFGCSPSTNLQIQVAQQSSNTPMLSYPVSCPGGATVNNVPHNLLSLTHPDTVPKSPPSVGDIIYGSPVGNPPTGIWSVLGIGSQYEALTVGAKVLGHSSPEWGPIHLDQSAAVTGILPVGNGGTGVNTMTIHGVLIGQTTSPIHVTTAGNASECLTSNGAGADPTFQPCPGGSNPCDITQVTNWYVATTGNDTTGDGSVGLPWLTIQHAVDQIPGIVCGRYIINIAAGTYDEAATGGVIVAGRVFAGGNQGADPTIAQWPINDANYGSLAYSWLQFLGDPTSTVTSNYVVQNSGGGDVFAFAGSYATLEGLTVDGGTFGVHSALGSFVNLNGVQFINNGVAIMGTEGSTVHIDCCDFVDGGASSVLITNGAGFDAVEMADDSLLTDFQSDGNNTNTFAVLTVTEGTGGNTGQCFEFKYSRAYFRGRLNCEISNNADGIDAFHSRLEIQKLVFDGGNQGTQTGIRLESSELGWFTGNGDYTISNATNGVQLSTYSFIDTLPGFSGVTTNFKYALASSLEPLNHPAYVANVTVIGSVAAIGTTTLVPTASETATYRVSLVINCKAVGAGDTITPTITYKDASNTTQTITTAAADCTALGAGSIASINSVFRAERNFGAISYETAIANTPLYDITVTLERLTID